MRSPALAAVGLATVAGLWAVLLGWWHLTGERTELDRLEASFADVRLLIAGPRSPPQDIVIVAIDDATVSKQGGYPLSRSTLARLVLAINAGSPQAIALDLLLVDQTNPPADHELANALKASPAVIAAAGQFERSSSVTSSGVPRTSRVLWPAAPFGDAAKVGLVNIATDASGSPRHLPLLFETDRGLQPSFALRAAALTGGNPDFSINAVRIDGAPVALDLGYHLPLRFYGPRGTLETISAHDLLAGQVPPHRLANRIAVVGVTATGIGDSFGTAFDPVMPGVEVLATGIAQLAGGGTLVRDTTVRTIDAAATVLLAVGATLAILLMPVVAGVLIVVASVLAWVLMTVALFGHGYWFSVVLPLAGVVPPVAVAMVIRQVSDRRRAREVARAEAALRQFQAPVLAERIARDPDFLRNPVTQVAAVLFIDLSGFTQLSEQLGLTRTRNFLHQFHSLVADKSIAQGGLVMSFMGDGAMIAFGIPDAHSDDAGRAFTAAWGLLNDVREWIVQAGMPSRSNGVRLGGHFGSVVISRLGHELHQHITATGDTVNVASRMMEVAKEHGAALAVTAEFFSAVGDVRRLHREPDDIRDVEIRGRRAHVTAALWRA